MTLRRLVLLRHGQTDYNVERRMQGHLDAELTADGPGAGRGGRARASPRSVRTG